MAEMYRRGFLSALLAVPLAVKKAAADTIKHVGANQTTGRNSHFGGSRGGEAASLIADKEKLTIDYHLARLSALEPGIGAVIVGDGATWQTAVPECVPVTVFGAKGDGTTDDTAAIQTACASKRNLFFPAGEYLITSTITPSDGAWFGSDAQRGFEMKLLADTTRITCSGANSGTGFLSRPPRMMKNIWLYGIDKTGVGVTYGAEKRFGEATNRRWENVRVSHFATGIKGYNWFSNAWDGVWIDNNIHGIDISPIATGSDGGYFTSTDWSNIYITDNSGYGLKISCPAGTYTFTGCNVVIENNGRAGTEQAHLINVTWTVQGLYLEGTSSIPAIRMKSCRLTITNGHMNNTGGLDLTNNTSTLYLNSFSTAEATDRILNVSEKCNIRLVNCSMQQDVRKGNGNVGLFNAGAPHARGNSFFSSLAIGKDSASGIASSTIGYVAAYQKVVTGTVPAHGWLRIVTDQHNAGIWDGASHAIVTIAQYAEGLFGRAMPGSHGSNHHFCVDLINTTPSDVTLASVPVNILFIKSEAVAL